jgi:hypothetical protein
VSLLKLSPRTCLRPGSRVKLSGESHLHIGVYFKNEPLLMLQRVGFKHVIVQGDHNDSEEGATNDCLVFVAK